MAIAIRACTCCGGVPAGAPVGENGPPWWCWNCSPECLAERTRNLLGGDEWVGGEYDEDETGPIPDEWFAQSEERAGDDSDPDDEPEEDVGDPCPCSACCRDRGEADAGGDDDDRDLEEGEEDAR